MDKWCKYTICHLQKLKKKIPRRSEDTRDQEVNGCRIGQTSVEIVHVFQASAAPAPMCYLASSWW